MHRSTTTDARRSTLLRWFRGWLYFPQHEQPKQEQSARDRWNNGPLDLKIRFDFLRGMYV